MINNKTTGTAFERAFANILSQSGFWVHLFQDNKNGQPCDVIAARNGHTYLFDCKNCENDFFLLNRMEENQYNAMHLFELMGNSRGKMAVRFPKGDIYLIDYWQVKTLREHGTRRLDQMSCVLYGHELGRWLTQRNAIDGWSEKNADNHWKRT